MFSRSERSEAGGHCNEMRVEWKQCAIVAAALEVGAASVLPCWCSLFHSPRAVTMRGLLAERGMEAPQKPEAVRGDL